MSEDYELNRIFKETWFNDNIGSDYIYHFTSIDSLIKILLTDIFRLSLVERMNDINESQPIHKKFGFKLDKSDLEIIKKKKRKLEVEHSWGALIFCKKEKILEIKSQCGGIMEIHVREYA
jgi:hypothetical protein